MSKPQKLSCFAVLILFAAALCLGVVFLVRYPVKYKNYVNEYATNYIKSELLFGVIKAESGFNERAVSNAGALGLMQIMPNTASYVAKLYNLQNLNWEEELFNPQINIQIGALYLEYLLKRFNGNLTYVLVAYNAGETKTSEWINSTEDFFSLAYPVSLNYAKKVLKYAKVYKRLV